MAPRVQIKTFTDSRHNRAKYKDLQVRLPSGRTITLKPGPNYIPGRDIQARHRTR